MKSLNIELEGKRDLILSKMKAVYDLAEDLNLSVRVEYLRFKCDDPKCGFILNIPEGKAADFNHCPKCGVRIA